MKGKLIINGPDEGTWYLLGTKASDRYNKLKDSEDVQTIDKKGQKENSTERLL